MITATMPPRIARLDRDARGYPIPWNVLRKDGKPYFIVNDDRKHLTALFGGLCPICGGNLERMKWFVGGPLSAFHAAGCYLDLPMHHDCAQYALSVCPWLAAPRYSRDDEHRLKTLPPGIFLDPTQIPDRPRLFVTVASFGITADLSRMPLLPRVKPRAPIRGIEYWQHGVRMDDESGERLVREVMGASWTPPPVVKG